jgi:murein DD-endopeptidase MepM/ murein hydrolase activator NlpD
MGSTGQPVGSITPGTVLYVGNPYANSPGHTSLGYVVQVLGNDGFLYHYQHLEAPAVHQGDVISVGSVVGVSGGCPVGCYGSNGQCTCTDAWTTGQHIEVRRAQYNGKASDPVWGQPWKDPYQAFLQLAGVTATSGAGKYTGTTTSTGTDTTSSSSPGPNLTGFVQKAGIFTVSVVLVLFGFYLLFKKQADGILQQGARAAKLAVIHA